MAQQYVTSQGDTWDAIAFAVYGDEACMKDLIEANPDYAGVFEFEGNVLINIPTVEEEQKADAIPFWRTQSDSQMDADEEGGDEYSDEEDYEEDDEDEDDEDDEDEDEDEEEDEEDGDYPEEDEGDE